jgi:hypothetical protein
MAFLDTRRQVDQPLTSTEIRKAYEEDPERAERTLFGRVSYPDRRGFLRG